MLKCLGRRGVGETLLLLLLSSLRSPWVWVKEVLPLPQLVSGYEPLLCVCVSVSVCVSVCVMCVCGFVREEWSQWT